MFVLFLSLFCVKVGSEFFCFLNFPVLLPPPQSTLSLRPLAVDWEPSEASWNCPSAAACGQGNRWSLDSDKWGEC